MTVQQVGLDIFLQEDQEQDECISEITDDELWSEIDKKARQYLNISGREFAELYQQGTLPDSFAVAELGFLLRCIDGNNIPA